MEETLKEAAEAVGHKDHVLPEALLFLNWGWWVVHVVGIIALYLIGRAVGKKCAAAPSPPPTES